jgi:NADH:ubiquinone oxidoreductase subunit D
MNTFFVCPECGNDKDFKIFTSNFQVVRQSPELGVCTDVSVALPNLRQHDNYIECVSCLKRYEYNDAIMNGRRYVRAIRKLKKIPITPDKQNAIFLS